MPDGDDLMQKADALMRRRHVEADAAEREAEAPPEPSPSDADVPVLTEIVDEPAEPPAPPGIAAEEVRSAVAGELEAWLDEQLPQHVMRVLDGLTDQLILQVSRKAKSELLPRLQAAAEAAARPVKPAASEDEA